MRQRRARSTLPVQCYLFLFYDGEVPEFARRLTVRHRHCVWWHILSGNVSVWTPGAAVSGHVDGEAGTTLFIAQGASRHHRFSPDARILSLHFAADDAEGRPLASTLPVIVWPAGGAAPMVAAAKKVAAAMRTGQGQQLSAAFAVRGALHLFVAALLEALEEKGVEVSGHLPPDPRLEAVLSDLRENPRAGPLPFGRWSRLTGLGRSQLDRLCRSFCGESLRVRRDGILMARLERALAADARDIKALAYEHGFVDASHLTRWFRRQSGTTPGAFRRSLRPPGAPFHSENP